MKRGFLVNFVIGLLISYGLVVFILPVTMATSGVIGLVKGQTNHEEINWGKGDPWTPERPYVCPGGYKHPDLKYHCTRQEYFTATFGFIVPFTLLLLFAFFVAPIFAVVEPDAWLIASLHLIPICAAILIAVILTRKESRRYDR